MARLRIRIVLVAAAAMLLAACGDQDTETQSTAEPTAATTSIAAPGEPSTSSTSQSTESTQGFVPDYAALIAAVDGAMEGTAYEGVALEDVEVFVATAELFCDLLDEGLTTDEVLADYLDRLSNEDAEEIDEDDGLMAGVLLGAAVEIVCPEHAATIP